MIISKLSREWITACAPWARSLEEPIPDLEAQLRAYDLVPYAARQERSPLRPPLKLKMGG